MRASGTVLLTTDDADLIDALRRALPDFAVQAITTDLPPCKPGVDTWCFIDLLLPETSGLALCRRLRATPATSGSTITLVLDEDSPELQRRALQAGADDYMTGPLTCASVLRRIVRPQSDPPQSSDGQNLKLGDFQINLRAHNARWRDKQLVLSASSFTLLCRFLEAPNHVLTRDYLIAQMGRDDLIHDERTVDVWVGRLRRSLRRQGVPDPLRTVRSIGYVLDSPRS